MSTRQRRLKARVYGPDSYLGQDPNKVEVVSNSIIKEKGAGSWFVGASGRAGIAGHKKIFRNDPGR